MIGSPVLSAILFLPLAGALVMLLLPNRATVLKGWAVAVTGATLLLSLAVVAGFETAPGFQFTEKVNWLSLPWPVAYELGVDGISLFLVPLTALLALLVVAATNSHTERIKGQLALLLALEWATLGVFLSLDLAIFYIFWDLMLIPTYFLMVGWGGSKARPAALKYLLYNGIGGLFMLLGLIALAWQGETFSLPTLLAKGFEVATNTGSGTGIGGGFAPGAWTEWTTWAFLALALGFAVKIPLFPFHSWMPDTYRQSPTAVTAFLSGVQSKAGLYGLLRIALPLLPESARAFGPIIVALALAGVLYGAVIALTQRNGKEIVAYSSLSHLGLVVVALFAFNETATQGAVLQMVNHGLFAGGLFLLLGMIERRTGTLSLDRLSGLAKRAPIMGAAFLITAMAALGLPGLNGFAGEFLMLLGILDVSTWYVVIGLISVVAAAAYMLRLYQGLMNGPSEPVAEAAMLPNKRASVTGKSKKASKTKTVGADIEASTSRPIDLSGFRDLSWAEIAVLLPLVALIIWLGVQPRPIPDRVAGAVRTSIETVTPVPDETAAQEGSASAE